MPELTDTRLKIEKIIEDEVIIAEQRSYLGLSQIGHECPRFLWYSFRLSRAATISARINRLFQRGHREEPVIMSDLKKAGVKVHSMQKEVVAGYGHIRGHIDGLGDNIPDAPKTTHLLEFKTVKEGRDTKQTKYHFHKLREVGVKNYNPVYYAQCQCYMHLEKLKRTLFIAVNKNNDARYYERIKYVKSEAEFYLRRGESIIFKETPPLKFESYKCSWCDYKPLCDNICSPDRNCRTCRYGDMEDGGQWACSLKSNGQRKYFLTFEQQREGCDNWCILKNFY